MYGQCMDSNFQRSFPLPDVYSIAKKCTPATILKEMHRQNNPAVSEQSSAVAGGVIYAVCQQLT